MSIEDELDFSHQKCGWYDVRRLVVASRKAFDTFSLPNEEQKNLDEALERFSELVPYDDESCQYCSFGLYSGLPHGDCENCMNTGLNNGY